MKRSFLVLVFAVVCGLPIRASEVYAPNVDGAGTDDSWTRYVPTSGGPTWPVALVIASAHFNNGSAPSYVAMDLAAAGFLAFAVEHRLAPPHSGNPQVDPPSDGRPPQQTDDIQLAILAARGDSQCNGKVVAVSGSGGANLTAWWGVSGTSGQDRLDAFVGLSGPYDLDSTDILNNTADRNAIENYINHTTDEGATFDAAAKAASPYWLTISGTPARALLFTSSNDSVPASECSAMVTKLGNAGAIVQTYTRTGAKHSFDYWYLDCGAGCTFASVKDASIDFLQRAVADASPTPTPTASPTPTSTPTPTPTNTPIVSANIFLR